MPKVKKAFIPGIRVKKRWIEDRLEIRKLKKCEATWLAGVIDGKGSIGLYDYGKEGRRVAIQMSNTSEDFVMAMRNIIGAGSNVSRTNIHLSHKGRKPMYTYMLKGSNRCYKILKQIVPYLIIKKQKALDIINELETKPFGRWANATEEARKKVSERNKKMWANSKFRKQIIQKMRDYYKNKDSLGKHKERMRIIWLEKEELS